MSSGLGYDVGAANEWNSLPPPSLEEQFFAPPQPGTRVPGPAEPPKLGLVAEGASRYVVRPDHSFSLRQLVVIVIVLAAGANYFSWRIAMFTELAWIGRFFLGVEIIAAGLLVSLLWRLRSRSAPQHGDTTVPLSLDIVIPASGDAEDLLHEAIESARTIPWANRVVVANDANIPDGPAWRAIRSTCHDLGVRCITRFGDHQDEAATINHALDHLHGDIVLVLSPDQLVNADVIADMMVPFADPSISFVTSHPASSPNSADPLFWPDLPWAKTAAAANDLRGFAFATAAGTLWRRSALARIGGFTSGSNPALLTSKRLHSEGLESAYHHRPAVRRPGPVTASDYLLGLYHSAQQLTLARRYRKNTTPASVRRIYRSNANYFPATSILLLLSLAPVARSLLRQAIYTPSTTAELMAHIAPWAGAVVVAVLSVGGLMGGLAWMRSVLFAQSSMGLCSWIADAARTRSAPEGAHLQIISAVVPGILFAALILGVVDGRAGGSAPAFATIAVLLVFGGGFLLHGDTGGFSFVRWTMYTICLAIGAAALATSYRGWQPPAGLFQSFAPVSSAAATDPSGATGDEPTPEQAAANGSAPAAEDGANAPLPQPAPLPADIAPPSAGPVPHQGTLVASDGIYLGRSAPEPPSGWIGITSWPVGEEKPQILHWSQSWQGEPAEFRNDLTTTAVEAGAVPMVTWQAWEPPADGAPSNPDQPDVQLQKIIKGDFDAYIDSWAQTAATYESPILLRPFHDVNSSWYPWSMGNNKTGNKRFRAAWRHVVERFRLAGADNVGFVWSVAPLDPGGDTARLDKFYPGDDYVDWVAASGISWTAYGTWADAPDAASVVGPTYEYLQTKAKPIMVVDVGYEAPSTPQGDFVGDAMRYFSSLSELDAVVWFDRPWGTTADLRLSPEDQQKISNAIAEVGSTIEGGGPAAEGLRGFRPELQIAPGSTRGE